MTEKEKMLTGQLYMASDKTLTEERLSAKRILYKLDRLDPAKSDEMQQLFESLLGKTGENLHIELPFRCDYGYNIETGHNFFANYDCTILDCAKVTIGDDVLFGPYVSVFTATHPTDAKKRKQGGEFALPVTIGNNVWIGGNVIINPGITIGDNTVIGSGSVVTKDVPENVVAAGNPCRVLRLITDDDRSQKLE